MYPNSIEGGTLHAYGLPIDTLTALTRPCITFRHYIRLLIFKIPIFLVLLASINNIDSHVEHNKCFQKRSSSMNVALNRRCYLFRQGWLFEQSPWLNRDGTT